MSKLSKVVVAVGSGLSGKTSLFKVLQSTSTDMVRVDLRSDTISELKASLDAGCDVYT